MCYVDMPRLIINLFGSDIDFARQSLELPRDHNHRTTYRKGFGSRSWSSRVRIRSQFQFQRYKEMIFLFQLHRIILSQFV